MHIGLKVALGAAVAYVLFARKAGASDGAGGGGSVFTPGGSFGRTPVRPLWQGAAPWGSMQLGSGGSSIAGGGCILTVLTMAANAFHGTTLTPDVANALIRSAGGFSGSDMIIGTGAAKLGMQLPSVQKVSFDGGGFPTAKNIEAMRDVVDRTLMASGMVLLRVDHNRDARFAGDHTVLIHSKVGNTYVAADPALAKNIVIDQNLRGVDGATWGDRNGYQGVSVAPLFPA